MAARTEHRGRRARPSRSKRQRVTPDGRIRAGGSPPRPQERILRDPGAATLHISGRVSYVHGDWGPRAEGLHARRVSVLRDWQIAVLRCGRTFPGSRPVRQQRRQFRPRSWRQPGAVPREDWSPGQPPAGHPASSGATRFSASGCGRSWSHTPNDLPGIMPAVRQSNRSGCYQFRDARPARGRPP